MKHNYLIVFFSVLLVASLNLAGYSQDSVSTSHPKVIKSGVDSSGIQKKNINKSTDSTKQTKIKSLTEELTTPPSISDLISFGRIFWAIVIFIIGVFLIKFVTKVLELFAERSAKYRISIKGIVPVVRILGWSLIVYIIISGIFKPPAATLLAVAASLGIAIGFAAQDIFKNIFGGIMILFDRPFQVGDKIEAGQYYGEVVKIGLRSTRIVTADDSLVSIPNGDIMTRSVSNSNTGEANCQVVAEIYLPITVDTEKVRQIATEAAQVSKYIFLNKPITVLFFNEVKERRSYFKMRLKAYVMDIRYEFNFKSDMTELVMKELLKQKIISPSDFA
jgi:MscS family membrane protein